MIRRRNKAKILVIEGADRSGKETQTRLLQEYLFDRSFNVSKIEIPKYSSSTGKLIRRMLKNGTAQSLKHTFQILQFVNKFMVQTFELPEIRNCNDFVIFDRWSLSSVIYGKATGIDDDFVYTLYDRLIDPDCTIILSGPTYAKSQIDSLGCKKCSSKIGKYINYRHGKPPEFWRCEKCFIRFKFVAE